MFKNFFVKFIKPLLLTTLHEWTTFLQEIKYEIDFFRLEFTKENLFKISKLVKHRIDFLDFELIKTNLSLLNQLELKYYYKFKNFFFGLFDYEKSLVLGFSIRDEHIVLYNEIQEEMKSISTIMFSNWKEFYWELKDEWVLLSILIIKFEEETLIPWIIFTYKKILVLGFSIRDEHIVLYNEIQEEMKSISTIMFSNWKEFYWELKDEWVLLSILIIKFEEEALIPWIIFTYKKILVYDLMIQKKIFFEISKFWKEIYIELEEILQIFVKENKIFFNQMIEEFFFNIQLKNNFYLFVLYFYIFTYKFVNLVFSYIKLKYFFLFALIIFYINNLSVSFILLLSVVFIFLLILKKFTSNNSFSYNYFEPTNLSIFRDFIDSFEKNKSSELSLLSGDLVFLTSFIIKNKFSAIIINIKRNE